jgi:hypothetical protein
MRGHLVTTILYLASIALATWSGYQWALRRVSRALASKPVEAKPFATDDEEWAARRVLVSVEQERIMYERFHAGASSCAAWKDAQQDAWKAAFKWMRLRKTYPNRPELLAIYRSTLPPEEDAQPVSHDAVTKRTRVA